MDIEKLIEQYRNAADYWRKNKPDFPDVASSYEQAATALSTLQTENEKLRDKLERVTAERDAAIERLREWEKFDTYLLIHNFLPPEKWCGIKEDCL